MRFHPTALLIPVVATTLLAGCGNDDTTAVPTTTSTSETAPATGANTARPAPVPAESTEIPAPVEPTLEASALEGNGLCLDPASAPVADALAGLSDDGFAWQIEDSTDAVVGDCPSLMWLVAVGGNSASSPEHVLFFADGSYLGTATSEPYAYTSVVDASDGTVTAEYRWIAGDEPFCCPEGGPATVRYTWDGSQIVMLDPLPQEMLDSYN
ncbi:MULTISPECIES: LppP/LprE family lipoprotein [Rhodococcus]|uniref:LppP/LprE family lipoprotein n=1 Tax=Rhodococcus TaxID=1827 RepID=UPI000B5A8ADC|nr:MULTISPECIES: LppP/LprE family lipoprotein [Rhodococcus]MCR8692527.1 LppP/LprE family lipoprotein [Rhodococcus pyridinivorans]MXQ74667.1 LppP/LprE family lipoprotein [Rhodococcus rhodochrous]OWY82249.1 hypothetical protein B9C99_07965 [Rhodococcus sp. BUPNP1]BDB58875.1 hypothetical protein RDE2_06690 [Rhodococcus sp. RDE2]